MNQNWEDKSSKSKKYEKERQLLLAKNREEQKQLQRQFELEKQKRWALMEEKGDIEGMLSADDFHVGPMVVKKQTFGEITVENGNVFATDHFAGIAGLAFPALSAYSHTPVFDNIMNQKLLAVNMFAFYYSKLPRQESALFFGGPDPEFYTGKITWIPVMRQFYWEIRLQDIFIGNQPLHLCNPHGQ